MKEYTIQTGSRGLEMLSLMFLPDSEQKIKRIKEVNDNIDKEITNRHFLKKEEFIKEYGQEIFNFCESISKPNFLANKNNPCYLSWDSPNLDTEEDDCRVVYFYKGTFTYCVKYAGGYAGKDILEENLSFERVKELINDK